MNNTLIMNITLIKISGVVNLKTIRGFSSSAILSSDEDDNYGEGSSSNPNLGRDKGKRKVVDELTLDTSLKRVRFDFPTSPETENKMLNSDILWRKKEVEIGNIELENELNKIRNKSEVTSDTKEEFNKRTGEYEKARYIASQETTNTMNMTEHQHDSNMRRSRNNEVEEKISFLLSCPDVPQKTKDRLEDMWRKNEEIRKETQDLDGLENYYLRSLHEQNKMKGEYMPIKSSDTSDVTSDDGSMPSYTDPED